MFRKAIFFIFSGIVWLFLFSAPVGRNLTVFDVAQSFVVKSRIVVSVKNETEKIFDSVFANALVQDDTKDALRDDYSNHGSLGSEGL
jgi:hypothetical protein